MPQRPDHSLLGKPSRHDQHSSMLSLLGRVFGTLLAVLLLLGPLTLLGSETRTLLWFGHGCSGERMLWKHERYYGLGMDALVSACSRNTNVIWFGHGCSRERMLSKHARYYGLGMDALVSACSGNTNAIMVWAWMLS